MPYKDTWGTRQGMRNKTSITQRVFELGSQLLDKAYPQRRSQKRGNTGIPSSGGSQADREFNRRPGMRSR